MGELAALVVVQDCCQHFLGEKNLTLWFYWLMADLFQVFFALSHPTGKAMAVFAFPDLEEGSSPWLFDGDLQLWALVFEQESPCDLWHGVTCAIDHASERSCAQMKSRS